MSKFYFTYCLDSHPFKGGWTEIEAEDIKEAISVFRMYHPDKKDGFLNCCSVYEKESFKETRMYKNGNHGYRCHETILLQHTTMKGAIDNGGQKAG